MWSVRLVNEKVYMIDSLPEATPFLATYIINDDYPAIVDCGPKRSIKYLIEALNSLRFDPKHIRFVFLSHIHIDHAGGVGVLLKYLPRAKIVVHVRGAEHLVSPNKLWEKTKKVLGDLATFYGEIEPVPKERIIVARDWMRVDLGSCMIRIMETPGHASHSVTYHLDPQNIIFPGDTLGIYLEPWGISFPTTPKPFNAAKMFESIEKIRSLEPETICFPHYGVKNNAGIYIEEYEQQLEAWIRITEENVDLPTNKILKLLLEKRLVLGMNYQRLMEHKIWSGSLLRSIEGIKSYILWRKRS